MLLLTKIFEIITQKGSKYQKIKFGSTLYPQRALLTAYKLILCLSRLIRALLWKRFCLRNPLAMLHVNKILKIITQNDSIFQENKFGLTMYPQRALETV